LGTGKEGDKGGNEKAKERKKEKGKETVIFPVTVLLMRGIFFTIIMLVLRL